MSLKRHSLVPLDTRNSAVGDSSSESQGVEAAAILPGLENNLWKGAKNAEGALSPTFSCPPTPVNPTLALELSEIFQAPSITPTTTTISFFPPPNNTSSSEQDHAIDPSSCNGHQVSVDMTEISNARYKRNRKMSFVNASVQDFQNRLDQLKEDF